MEGSHVCVCGMMYMAFDLSPVDNFSLLSSSDLFGGEREIEGTFSSFPCTLYLHTWYFLRKQFRSIPRSIDSVKRAVSPTETIYGPDLVLNCSGVPRDLLQIALQLFCAIVRVRSSLKRDESTFFLLAFTPQCLNPRGRSYDGERINLIFFFSFFRWMFSDIFAV